MDLYVSLFEDKRDDFNLTDICGITDDIRDSVNGIDVYLK